ncbi:HAMP domain-containing protein [Geobacter pelophilus]|uniref:HAMP domain-containing protein n=1 Tax=Geoanaerobacter pelophilus TaxID=60036 RepID=A0AAW4L2J6_9BACT|nr:methyl-accepting chemotaxis protein [Geoanaerobacter pelophilus]MBT0665163.1 HAMP domain-containing protein [Geoanaerobacter pelophilus]
MNLKFGSQLIRTMMILGIIVAATGLLSAGKLAASSQEVADNFLFKIVFGILVIETLLFVITFWIYTKRKLLSRVNRLAHALERGAEGDLTIRVPASENDEIGQLGRNLNTMLEKLSEFVERVNASLRELRNISQNTTNAAGQLVNAAETQSVSAKETSGAVDKIGRSIELLSKEIDKVTQSATQNSGAIRTMSTSLDVVGQNIDMQSSAIDEVSSSIFQVAAEVKQIANNVNSLMATSTETTSSVAAMDISIKEVERNAQGAAEITETVKHDALVGQETVAATISGITEIRDSTQSTFSAIASLSSRVKVIGNIVSVINELAEQTNLLALNSAIIAAQAGEHGKGFAVVADQIKGLATRTRNSTQEIDDLISAIQKETDQAVTAIKVTEQRVSDGERLSLKSGVALQKMVSGMEESLRQVNDIAHATVEQAKGSQQIRQSMEDISNMVAQIAKSSREQGATSELIIAAVDRMKDLTVNVRSSSLEQREIGANISESTGRMGLIISELERLRNEQAERSDEIRKAMQEMDRATNEDLSAVHIMEEGVENLSRQIGLLQTEMAKLKVN